MIETRPGLARPDCNIFYSDLAVCDQAGLECWQEEKSPAKPPEEADECGCK